MSFCRYCSPLLQIIYQYFLLNESRAIVLSEMLHAVSKFVRAWQSAIDSVDFFFHLFAASCYPPRMSDLKSDDDQVAQRRDALSHRLLTISPRSCLAA